MAAHIPGMTFVNGSRPTALWDMDGTFVKWEDRFAELLLERDPDFPLPAVGERPHFDYFWVPGANRDVIIDTLNDPRLYSGLEPHEAAVQAMQEMDADGWDVFIASSPTWTNPGCAAGKLEDIDALLGPKWVDRLILSKDKTLVKGDVLFDDKPEITGAHVPSWTHIMVDQDYNRYVETPHRMTDPLRWRHHVGNIFGPQLASSAS